MAEYGIDKDRFEKNILGLAYGGLGWGRQRKESAFAAAETYPSVPLLKKVVVVSRSTNQLGILIRIEEEKETTQLVPKTDLPFNI